ncbi:ABC transporter substrate-binding protein [Candidatus Woesearchaeota archaeon]|nr:ABC transporter substrate-binding protein [Candidatus Woesearchaeota archaeon]
MKKQTKAIIGLVLTAFMLLGGCATSPTGQITNKKETIEVGFITGLTGGTISFGVPAANAAQIAVDEINEAGGINGKKLKLLFEDGECNSKKATDAANKLVNIDQIPVLFTICSTNTLAAAPIAEEKKTITFGAMSTSPAISEAGDYVFRISPKDTKGTALLAEHIKENGYNKIALLVAQDAYALSVKQDFEKIFTSMGGDIVISETFSTEQTDFRTELTKIKFSKPQAIMFIPLKTENSVHFLTQMKEIGIELPLFSTRSLVNTKAIEEVGDLMNGVIYAEIKFDENEEKIHSFLAKYVAKYGEDPTYSLQMTVGVYDAVNIIAESMNKCDENTECIKNQLYDLKDYQGLSGIISMDENGDPEMDFELKTLKEGIIIALDE